MKISVVTPSIRPEGLKHLQKSLEKQTLKDFEWLVELGIPGRGHDLNAAFNRALKRAKGELVVFYEDYTICPPDALQKFWDTYQEHPNTFFTAPLGKKFNLDDQEEQIRWDWRAWKDDKKDKVIPCTWETWEIDWGAAPLKVLKEIGGFDEALDQYWSCDNVNTGYRAHLAGMKFLNIFNNPAIALDHDALMKHPFREHYNPEFNNERIALFTGGYRLDPL